MTDIQAVEFVKKWAWAVDQLWKRVLAEAHKAGVLAPETEKEFGPYVVVLNNDGLHLIRGKSDTMVDGERMQFHELVTAREFRLPQLEEIARFIRQSIHDARVSVRTAIDERKAALDAGLGFLKQDIAEWNLSSGQGEEV